MDTLYMRILYGQYYMFCIKDYNLFTPTYTLLCLYYNYVVCIIIIEMI